MVLVGMESKKDMKDKELIEQIEALSEIVDWLEEKDTIDLKEASDTVRVDEEEVDGWLKSISLKKVSE